jgi:glycosyltransferase involved in cell wall biosynthesis
LAYAGVRTATKVLLIASACDSAFATGDRKRFRHKMEVFHSGFEIPEPDFDSQNASELRKSWGVPETAKLVGIVAAFHQRKGHDVLVKAANRILEKEPEAYLVFVGDASSTSSEYLQLIQQLVQETDHPDRFVWAGFCKDMNAAYSAIDVVVLPSRSEGLPGVLIEALAHGKPIVATPVGGVADIITDDVHGRMVPVDQEAELADAIVELLGTRFRNEEDSRTRRQYVSSKFSLERYAQRFDELVSDTLQQPVSPAAGHGKHINLHHAPQSTTR